MRIGYAAICEEHPGSAIVDNARYAAQAGFAAIEADLAADGRRPEDSDLTEMDQLWNKAKAAEKAAR